MKSTATAAACTAAFLAWAPWTIGQDHDHVAPLAAVNFPVSCEPEAQRRFNAAASLLYSFHWERIDQALAEVLDADPACGMVYWAKAVASLDNPLGSPPGPEKEKRGLAAVEQAKRLSAKTQRERDYIDAIAVIYEDYDTVPFKTRAAAYEMALEQLYLRYPEDSEAAVLYAFWLQVTADRNDQTYAKQLKSAAILERVFASQPQHPGAVHFLIHAYDFPPIAAQGLKAAQRYAAIAPDSPHALHMPSHIFPELDNGKTPSIPTSNRALRPSWIAMLITRSTTWCTRHCSLARMRKSANGLIS